MTLALNNARKSYVGNGATTAFTAPAAIEASHLEVKLLDATTGIMGAPLTINTHYTVSGANTFTAGQARAACTVTMMVAPTADQHLYIDCVPSEDQDLQYPESGAFPTTSHVLALDKLTMRMQALFLLMRRAIRMPDGNDNLDMEVPDAATRRGKALVFDDDTDAAANVADLTVASFHFVSGVPSSGLGANSDVAFDEVSWNVYRKIAGAWVLQGQITGATGTPGALWYTGSGVPGGGTGIDGDLYMRTAGVIGDVYQKVSGTWNYLTNIRGASGSGTGDIVGPAGATDGRFVLFDGPTGKLVKQHTGGPGALAVKATIDSASLIDAGVVTFAKLSDIATATQIRNNTADKILTTDDVYSANEPVVVSFSGTWAPDLNAGSYLLMTLTGGLTMGAPTNVKLGQEVLIGLIQDGTGGRAISLPSNFKLGTFTPSTAANKVDLIAAVVKSISPLEIHGSYKAGIN